MDVAAIIVKLLGLILFLFTVRSVYKHFKGKLRKRPPAQAQQSAPPIDNRKPEQHPQQQQHSVVEHALNTILLYAWFIFMTALSLGMIVNN